MRAGDRTGPNWHSSKAAQDYGDAVAEFHALKNGCGLVDFTARSQIELAGDDSPAFLHNFCTNDITKLVSGAGCEVFLTNVQGKIIGHGYVYRTPTGCLYETIPGVSAELLTYFDRYLFREQVELIDRSADWAELVIAGTEAPSVLQKIGLDVPEEMFSHKLGQANGQPCAVRRADFIAGPCFQLSVPRESIASLWESIVEAGGQPCGEIACNQARILHRTPVYGIDISEENLPQEVGRDQQAISFTKGCYIGQETVARIDALGHVNKTLCGIRISGQMPMPSAEVYMADDAERGKPVGKITSSSAAPEPFLADDVIAIALGYVRRGSNSPGDKLAGDGFSAEVASLPFEQ